MEIRKKAKERYNDYIVLDTSPDYVTGRVGKEQVRHLLKTVIYVSGLVLAF